MYINDIHILYYVGAAFLGGIIGYLVCWCNERLPEYKKVFSKEILQKEKRPEANFAIMIVNALMYVALLYFCGLKSNWIGNLPLIKYAVLTPMLLSALVIDYRLQIIPNRLNLTMFEIGLIFTFLYGIININMGMNMLLGGLAGAGIFLVITLLGGLIAGKEAMGFGDVKLMGALGLYFGLSNIIAISVLSFLIGAIASIVLIETKIKKTDEYIPFGKFIVISKFIVIFVPFGLLVNILLKIFTLGMYK